MVLLQKFRFYLAFHVVAVLLRHLVCRRFIGVWFVVGLLLYDVIRRLVAALYLCGDDSDR